MRKIIIAMSILMILTSWAKVDGQVTRNKQSSNSSNTYSQKLAKFDEVTPFENGLSRVMMKNKYGYIDKTGNTVIPVQYNYADYSFNDYNGVAMSVVENEDGFSAINNNGKLLFPPVDFKIYNIDGYYFKATKDKKWGLLALNGNLIIDIKYNWISFSDGIVTLEDENKTAYFNLKTNSLITDKYQKVSPFSDDLSAVSLNSRWGYIDKRGTEIIPLKYREAKPFKNGLAKVSILKKYGFINKQNREIVAVKYDEVEDEFTEGMCKVGLNGKYGFVDVNGSERVPVIYDECHEFCNGLAKVKLNDKYGKVDKYGNVVIAIKYEQIAYNNPIIMENGLPYLIYNNQKIRMNYDDIPDSNKSIIVVGKNDKYGWINKQGKVIIPLEFDKIIILDEAFVRVEKNNKIGIYSVNGNKVLEPIYDICPYSGSIDEDDNQFMVRLNGKWKFVSFEGKILLQ